MRNQIQHTVWNCGNIEPKQGFREAFSLYSEK